MYLHLNSYLHVNNKETTCVVVDAQSSYPEPEKMAKSSFNFAMWVLSSKRVETDLNESYLTSPWDFSKLQLFSA